MTKPIQVCTYVNWMYSPALLNLADTMSLMEFLFDKQAKLNINTSKISFVFGSRPEYKPESNEIEFFVYRAYREGLPISPEYTQAAAYYFMKGCVDRIEYASKAVMKQNKLSDCRSFLETAVLLPDENASWLPSWLTPPYLQQGGAAFIDLSIGVYRS